jgi:hypothetical protein
MTGPRPISTASRSRDMREKAEWERMMVHPDAEARFG